MEIYKILLLSEWNFFEETGKSDGSAIDLTDGYIHFSTAKQVRMSASKHRAGQSGLVLLSVDPDVVRDNLRWEPSRNGMLFPHFYGILNVSMVLRSDPIELNSMGRHVFPADVPVC